MPSSLLIVGAFVLLLCLAVPTMEKAAAKGQPSSNQLVLDALLRMLSDGHVLETSPYSDGPRLRHARSCWCWSTSTPCRGTRPAGA